MYQGPSRLLIVVKDVGSSLSPNAKLVEVISTRIHRAHEVPTGKGHTIRQLLSTPKMNRTNAPRDGSGTGHRIAVGDSQNNEERGDHLFISMISQ